MFRCRRRSRSVGRFARGPPRLVSRRSLTPRDGAGQSPGVQGPPLEADGAPTPTARRVLDAAVELLRTTGQLSMRKLAERAGVAGMTTYNLFGSKHGLLAALSRRELGRAVGGRGTPPGDALERVFAALDVGLEVFSGDEAYFRALYGAVYASGDLSLTQVFQAPRVDYWNGLLDDCRAEGLIARGARTRALTQILMHAYAGYVQQWIRCAITTEHLYAEINYALMILLLAHATPKGHDRIEARLRAWEARLPDAPVDAH